jgi:hypothetical protein
LGLCTALCSRAKSEPSTSRTNRTTLHRVKRLSYFNLYYSISCILYDFRGSHIGGGGAHWFKEPTALKDVCWYYICGY